MRQIASLSILVLAPTASAAPAVSKVEAIATQHAIHRGEPTVLEVRVTNTSAEKRTFTMWSCSWADLWRSDDAAIAVQGSDCDKNFAKVFELAAGASDVRTLGVVAVGDAAFGAHAVKLGWKAIGAKDTSWTAAIAFEVVEVSAEITVSHTKVATGGHAFSLANTTKRPLQIRGELTVQRSVDDAWTDLSPMQLSCDAVPPKCVTLEADKPLATREWQATTCAQCNCDKNGPVVRGKYRVVAHACDGKRDYVGDAVSLP
jgi:hypothetical protein